MGENSAIEWTHHTFNPWIGCTKVADGCAHCYAESHAKRTGQAVWGPTGTRVKTSEKYWQQPHKWNAESKAAGERRRVFCASLADVFEEWHGDIFDSRGEVYLICDQYHHGNYAQPNSRGGVRCCNKIRVVTLDDLRRDLFALIDATPWLDWLLLTKRPEDVRRMWPDARRMPAGDPFRLDGYRPNVWLLTSIATQQDASKNVPELLKCRDLVPVLGISAEPLLGPLRLNFHSPGWLGSHTCGIDWVIVGGESGHGARPMHPDWPSSIRDQCATAGVPFFFKQWGEWAPLEVCAKPAAPWSPCGVDRTHIFDDRETVFRIGKKAAGRRLDGKLHDEYPHIAVGRSSC